MRALLSLLLSGENIIIVVVVVVIAVFLLLLMFLLLFLLLLEIEIDSFQAHQYWRLIVFNYSASAIVVAY